MNTPTEEEANNTGFRPFSRQRQICSGLNLTKLLGTYLGA